MLRALSVMQPWASLIVGFLDPVSRWRDGQKSIENRTWQPSPKLIGERIAIHASKKVDPAGFAAWQAHGDPRIDIYKHIDDLLRELDELPEEFGGNKR